MVFKDKKYLIHLSLIEEYGKTDASVVDWRHFISLKDLGIIVLSWERQEYRITDEKKWTLAKIKYGI
jgi:hypothetical protein